MSSQRLLLKENSLTGWIEATEENVVWKGSGLNRVGSSQQKEGQETQQLDSTHVGFLGETDVCC